MKILAEYDRTRHRIGSRYDYGEDECAMALAVGMIVEKMSLRVEDKRVGWKYDFAARQNLRRMKELSERTHWILNFEILRGNWY